MPLWGGAVVVSMTMALLVCGQLAVDGLDNRKTNKRLTRNKIEMAEAVAEYDKSQDPFMLMGKQEIEEMCLDA